MKWDVFVSHASEDKPFVRELVNALEEAGLRVWFDELTLHAGDSLNRSISQGLSESEYGIVVLSANFFAKEWPKKELDGLVAREDGKEKVIIPIWHNISVEDVRRFSPILADKLSIYSSGPVSGVVEKILRAIYHERVVSGEWSPPVQVLPDETELVLLPVRPYNNLAVGIAKHPITNSQYKRFMAETSHTAPVGEAFRDDDWHGPFVPLDHPTFNNPDQPVVCVDYKDAYAYCLWISRILNQGREEFREWENWAFLPLAELWDFAAYGKDRPNEHIAELIFNEQQHVHHSSDTPAMIDDSGARTNKRGVSDMFGNVWEWCSGDFSDDYRISLIAPRRRRIGIELRGGSFLDDLQKMKKRPSISASILEDGINTRHTDLGFRIAAVVRVNNLSQEDRVRLTLQQRFPSYFWRACEYAARFDVSDDDY